MMREKLIDLTNVIVYSKRIKIVKHQLKSPYNKFEEIMEESCNKCRVKRGKSTLTKLLTGLYLPSKGEITSDNKYHIKLLSGSNPAIFAVFISLISFTA